MFQESYMRKIVALIGVMAVIALAAYTYHTLKSTKYIYSGPTTINVMGEGEVFATPDIASFSFTVNAREADVAAAQNKSSETMSAVLAYLEEAGIEKKDIKTEYYNLSPYYEPAPPCTPYSCPQVREQKIIGYEVSQAVTVKVRDTEKIGEVISGVGDKGAQNVTSISFTIDDEDTLMDEARALAIEDAKEKAEVLAKNLGARIVRMNGYGEEQGYNPYYYAKGGVSMDMAAESAVAPRAAEVPLGENTITSRVYISYEIR